MLLWSVNGSSSRVVMRVCFVMMVGGENDFIVMLMNR